MVPDARVTVLAGSPVDVRRTLSPLRRGAGDPSHRVAADGTVWRATLLASGPATVALRQTSPVEVDVRAWGPGAEEAVATARALVGADDDVSTFAPPPGPVRDAWRRTSAVRMVRTGRVLEALVPAVLEQRVQGVVAFAAWRTLVRAHGTPAPGPAEATMHVPPPAEVWARIPTWDFHRAGVDPARARTVVAVARLARRMEEAVHLPPAEALARLRYVPGVGVWTAAETAQRAFGDPDAVSVGDFHLAKQVGWALVGERVDDAAMLELLEPFRPHRYRAVRHLLLAGMGGYPRYGPRLSVEDHRGR